MVPDDRARTYYERISMATNPGVVSADVVALLVANQLRNAAIAIDRICPRNEGIADQVRLLAADLTDFSLRDAVEEQRAQDRASAESDEFVRRHG